jgi:hypothetical protein
MQQNKNGKLLAIKYHVWKGETECPHEIADKLLCIDGDIGETLIRLLNN